MRLNKHGLQLLPEHVAVLTTDENYLIAADLHLGKSAAFRAHGLPIPEGDTKRDLNRLSDLVSKHRPDHLVIAGDLFHAESGQTKETVDALLAFIDEIQIPFILVKGNHDKKIRQLPEEIKQVEDLDINSVRIVHKPEDAAGPMFHICGHVHPVIKIPDGRNISLRLPCFHLQGQTLTLPSFGSFTGGHVIKPLKDDQIFVSHMDQVIEVPKSLL
ncbi:MAG: ligase-associated DNA damage response endonuclease PdeM [Akkermansiaceae bacterium]